MEVYIEYVIIDNLIINSFIIYLCSKLLHISLRKLNILLSALIGTVFAIFMPFISINTYILFALKLCLGIIMCLVLKKFSFKKLLIFYITFLGITFMLGGLIMGLMYLIKGSFSINGIIINGFDVPIGLFIGVIFAHVYLLTKLISVLKTEHNEGKSIYRITISYNGKQHSLNGFLDTGNSVYDNNHPVIILSYKSFNKIFKDIPLESIISKDCSAINLNSPHYIQLNSVSSAASMLVFNIGSIQIHKDKQTTTFDNVTAGLSYKNFNSYDCLLHPDFF